MSYKVEQCRIIHGGRHFHFVSYDAQPANPRRGDEGTPAMWYLMGPGKRWPVMAQVPGQSDGEVEHVLRGWIEETFPPITPALRRRASLPGQTPRR